MDSINLNRVETTLPGVRPEDIIKAGHASQAQKKQFADDFESVFIEKLLDEMKNTIGEWGFEQDGASRQIQGLFWLHLARDIGAKGGLGLSKEIYQSLNQDENKLGEAELLDNKL